MSPLPSDKFQSMLDQLDHFYSKQESMKISEAMNTPQFYSIQEVMKTSEAMNNPYNQISDTKKKTHDWLLCQKTEGVSKNMWSNK